MSRGGYTRIRFRQSLTAPLSRWLLRPSQLHHNGTPVLEYPERDWEAVVFPAQKGAPFVADNLATVNAHDFASDARFGSAYEAARSRWKRGSRDIRWRLHTFLWAAETALRVHPDGDLVELGTGEGFMAAGLCRYLDWGTMPLTRGRTLWLVDTFETERPDERGSGIAERFYYAKDDRGVRDHFSRYPDVRVLKGLLPDAADDLTADTIAFVHVDLNHAGAELASLERLSARLRPGAVVLFDDSGNPGCQPQLAAHREWADSRGAPFLMLPTGQGLCILPADTDPPGA